MLRSSFLALSVLLLPSCAAGQANPDSIHHRNRCRLAAQVIESGHPAPREEWALEVIMNCADAGPALADALWKARASTDTAYVNALTAPMIQLRDGKVFTQAIAISSDRTAAAAARVGAIRVLMYALRPGGYVDPSVLVHTDPRNCFETPSPHSGVIEGSPLPADYREQVRTVAWRLFRDENEHVAVRRAAACAIVSAGR